MRYASGDLRQVRRKLVAQALEPPAEQSVEHRGERLLRRKRTIDPAGPGDAVQHERVAIGRRQGKPVEPGSHVALDVGDVPKAEHAAHETGLQGTPDPAGSGRSSSAYETECLASTPSGRTA